MKKTIILFLGIICSIGIGRAETLATVNYGTTSHQYLDVAKSTYNATISARGTMCVSFGAVYLESIKGTVSWFSTTATKSNSNVTVSSFDYAANGFLTYAGNSTATYTKAYGRYGITDSKFAYFWVTGITSVAIIGASAGNGKNLILHIDEVGSDGTTFTGVGTDVSIGKTAAAQAHTLKLNASSFYRITVSADNTSNNYFGQIRFETVYPVTISAAGWASLYLPFNAEVPEGATAYYANAISESTIDLIQVPLTDEKRIIKANNGVLINGDVDETYLFEYTATTPTSFTSKFSGVTEATEVSALSPAVPSGSSAFVLGLDENNQNLGFYPVENTFTLAAYKAYLIAPAPVSGGAPSMHFVIEEENNATDINSVEDVEKATKFIQNGQLYIRRAGVVYDLNGCIVK